MTSKRSFCTSLTHSLAIGLTALLILSVPNFANASSMTDGLTAFQQGNFKQALASWQDAEKQARASGDAGMLAEAQWRQAEANRSMGAHLQAIDILEFLKPPADNAKLRANILASYGDSLAKLGNFERGEETLQESIELSREINDQTTLAVSLNNLGNLQSAKGETKQAIASYQQSSDVAARSGNASLQVKALINAANIEYQEKNNEQASSLLLGAIKAKDKLPSNHATAFSLVAMGRLAWKLYKDPASKNGQWLPHVYQLLTEADTMSRKLGDYRAESYAAGYLGQLYQDKERYDEALILTERAIFAAQQADAPESAYLWYWQVGRIYKAMGNIDAAIAAYRLAVENVQAIRQQLSTRTAFKSVLGPVFFELTDLLLQRPNALSDKEQIEKYLLEARQTMELLKAAELQDFFQDNCVTALQSRVKTLDKVESHTAILYPILLDDRVEILLSMASGMERIKVDIGRERLGKIVTQFRYRLEKRTTHQYMRYSKQLYDLLIRPMEPMLAANNIDTLVIVPDSVLRTIPMAALHDGKQFLIAKYALATTPGLSLTDVEPLARDKVEILAGGLTDGVQGFPPLPNVSIEMDNIGKSYNSTVLMNKQYNVNSVDKELSQTHYNIVHIASHAQFTSDPNTTFLLAYDDKFTMDKLESLMGQTTFRDDPVELLTLSACQTAAGDERAALGLAGIAIKAGARSALATLWFINDQASSLLVSEFYNQLKNPALSKAKALQQAQLILMKDKRYRHPSYWAPFLLIGNWL
jgi:CHAT domain-containing protein